MEVNRAGMEQALEFLSNSDVDFARAKTLYDGLSLQRKTVKANCFIRSGEKSAASKEQTAYQMPDYVMHLQKVETANLEYLTLLAQRSTAVIVIDCWRSLNAARNKGQIV
jgi:hypothetical protein